MSNENKIMLKNVLMIDIETSGQNPGCRVMTLGAYGFNTSGEQCEFYRRFDSVKLHGIPGVDSEIAEIETLLKGGVVL